MKYKMIPDAKVWEDMDGETKTIKRLNSFLTVRFIERREIPSDECLEEARHLVRMWEEKREGFEPRAADYLVEQFATVHRYDQEKEEFDPIPEREDRLFPAIWHAMAELVRILEGSP